LEPKELKARRINYAEMVVPSGGIILTMGVDVQHNRFAIIIRAWGRNGNSWLVYWGEIYGFVKDPEDLVWAALTEMCMQKIPHQHSTAERALALPISAISIDSGDGNTTQLVYNWVKSMAKINPYTFATKGSSDSGAHIKEIFTVPGDPDALTSKGQRKKVAETMGVNVYIVGVQQGKDEVLRKLNLEGSKDRSFHYMSVRNDYEEQLLSNKKRLNGAGDATRYELVMGKRDEALDCEVLALHASRALHLHVWSEKHWQQAEKSLINASHTTSGPNRPVSNVTPGIN
jgi:phage terminase large subunit GpA-like protein